MLGAIIGDIVGSAYEFHNHRRTDFEPLFHLKAKFTDDTVCTIAIADALTRGIEPQDSLIEWCRRYAENGGWGKRFALWFMSDNPQPYGSWGNGGAMRISPVGFLATTEEQLIDWSDHITNTTHNHQDAIASARAVALAIFWLRRKVDIREVSARLSSEFGYDLSQTPDEIRPTYKRTESAKGSVPQAIVCALQSNSFENAIRTAVSIGGDSDTITAIAGSIAEAMYGLPEEIAGKAWAYLPKDMQQVLKNEYAGAQS